MIYLHIIHIIHMIYLDTMHGRNLLNRRPAQAFTQSLLYISMCTYFHMMFLDIIHIIHMIYWDIMHE